MALDICEELVSLQTAQTQRSAQTWSALNRPRRYAHVLEDQSPFWTFPTAELLTGYQVSRNKSTETTNLTGDGVSHRELPIRV